MKKLFVILAAAFAMVACQTDINEVGVVADGVAAVEFEVGTPQMRSYSDGKTATVLQYAVYEVKADQSLDYLEDLTPELPLALNELKANVRIELATNKKYAVIFWAAAPSSPYTFVPAEKKVTVDYTNATCNDENRDAFYAYQEFEVRGAAAISVVLRRPFAQVNIGAIDVEEAAKSNFVPSTSALVVKNVYSTLNLVYGTASDDVAEVTFAAAAVPTGETFPVTGYDYMAMSYVLVGKDKASYDVEYTIKAVDGTEINNTIGAVPMQANYRTNIYGKLLTSTTDINVEINPGYNEPANDVEWKVVGSAQDLQQAIEELNESTPGSEGESVNIQLTDDINLNDLFASLQSRATVDPSLTIKNGKELTLDLGGKKLSATSSQTGKNYNMFDVKGTLTVVNGTIEYKHLGENMGWGASTNIFNVTAGGVLNLEGVTAKNLGGSDMAFVAHLNNWGSATLNVNNSTLESTYIAVRAFNSGPDMNNITVSNSTLKGKFCYWVHNYKAAGDDNGTDATLNVNIYNGTNTFVYTGKAPVLYGFANPIYEAVVKSEAELAAALEAKLQVAFDADVEITTPINIAKDKNVVIKLNNNTVSGVDNGTASYGLITNNGNLTIEGPGKMAVSATNNRGWNAYSSVISNQPNGVLVVNGGTIEHLGGTDMAYGIDVLTNGNIGAAHCTINGGHIKSTYRAIRQFLNSDSKMNTLVVNGGVIEGANKSIWMQDPSAKSNTGKLVVEEGAQLKGDVYLYVCEGSTEWPVEVSIASAALVGESQVLTGNVPFGYEVVEENGVWIVIEQLVAATTAELQAALAAGQNVILANDLTISSSEMLTAPYGNKMALNHNGGVFNGNGKTIGATIGGDNYVVMTNGGTIKDLNINNGFRGVVIMSANQTINLDNVVVGGEGVCYALNTAEGDSTQDLVATNCTFNGWSSWSLLKSAKFTNCTFGQGAYYTNVYGRLGKPYVTTLFDGCEFGSKFYIDLSALGADQVVTLKNCTVNGVKLTAENWTSLVAPEDTCGEGQISVELKNGTYLTAENVADYIVFE